MYGHSAQSAQRVKGWPHWQMSFERLRPSYCYEKMSEKTLKGAILWVYDMSIHK